MTAPRCDSIYRGHTYWRVVYKTGVVDTIIFSRGITRSKLLRLLPQVREASPCERPAPRMVAKDNFAW